MNNKITKAQLAVFGLTRNLKTFQTNFIEAIAAHRWTLKMTSFEKHIG